MNATRENTKFDPVTALDRRVGSRDRRKSDRGGVERRRSNRMFSGKRLKIIAIVLAALVCSVISARLINNWFEGELSRYKSSIAQANKPAPLPPRAKVLVAASRITYGMAINAGNLKLIDWQADAVPTGSFTSLDALKSDKGKRLALTTIEANEPILMGKITGPGQKASLSAILADGMKAVTVRVNDVLGVAGLVHPNDRVDILWTMSKTETDARKEPFTQVLIKNVRVLAIDQKTIEKTNKALVAKAVTLEVSLNQAQNLALGSQTGMLSLALRGVATKAETPTGRVLLSRLGQANLGARPTIIVRRGVVSKNYDVLRHQNH